VKYLHLSSAVETRYSLEAVRCCRQQYIRHSALKNSLFVLTITVKSTTFIYEALLHRPSCFTLFIH